MYLRTVQEFLDSMERFMADVGYSLMIKYGLPSVPSKGLIDRWLVLVESLIEQGYSRDVAGSAAAKQIFPGFETHLYASEADDIETLLSAARRRDD